MKELWLAKDRNGDVNGFHEMPRLDGKEWFPANNGLNYLCKAEMNEFGIDVTSFNITHEKPLKIRAVWEVCND